jgi:hypothetical protein
MIRGTVFGTLMLALIVASPGHAQVRLDRKYVEGASYTTETVSQVAQTLTIAGMPTETSADTRVVSKVATGKRESDGTLRVKDTTEAMQVTISAQGSNYTFDSKMPDNQGSSALEILREIHKGIVGHTSTTILNRENQIQSIEFDQNLLGSLAPETQALVKSQLDPEYLKRVAIQDNERLPSNAVRKGDNWVRTENTNFGAGQMMTFQTEYTYQGTIETDGKTLDRITSKTLSVAYSIQDSPLPLTLKSSDLKAESDGELLFDRERGRVIDSRSTVRITGNLVLVAGGQDLPSQLDLKITSAVVEQPK